MLDTYVNEFVEWSTKTFVNATALSSLVKLNDEIFELVETLAVNNKEAMAEEYVDCIMCLFHSAALTGISPQLLTKVFAEKLYKNIARQWQLNDNNTYSHVKQKTNG